MKIRFLTLLAVLCALSSCHRDEDNPNVSEQQTTVTTVPLVFEEIEGTLVGYIYDEQGQAVENAVVSVYSGETTTNEFGIFRFNKTGLDGQGTLVTAKKVGYFDTADFVYPNDNGSGVARIKMLQKEGGNSFESTEGGSITTSQNTVIDFNPNSIAFDNGSSYNGTVNVDAKSFSQNDVFFGDDIYGGNLGVLSSSKNVIVGILAGVNIKLSSDNDPLKIKAGTTFNLSFAIPASYQGQNPNEIELWFMDEATGYWKESGKAIKVGNTYTATVDKIGQWAVGQYFSMSHFCARLIDQTGQPARNFNYKFLANDQIVATGISDMQGFICTKLPLGTTLKLEVLHPFCDGVLDDFSFSPLDEVENVGNLVISMDALIQTGRLLCSGDPFSDALILIRSNVLTIVVEPNSSGEFFIDLNAILCDPSDTYSIFAINNMTNEVSEPIVMNEDIITDFRIDLCEPSCDLSLNFDFQVLDWCVAGEYISVNAEVSGGSGNYAYAWDDGGVGVSSSTFSVGIDKCITVTDLDNDCSVNFCEEVRSYSPIRIEDISASNALCEMNTGQISHVISGGKGNYSFQWSNNQGYSSDLEVQENLMPSTYTLIVTDEKGCMDSDEVVVHDVTTPLESNLEDFCNESVITLESLVGYEPLEINWSGGGSVDENTLFIDQPGMYVVTVTDANGCARIKSFEIGQVGMDINILASLDYDCAGSEVLINPLNNVEYEVFNGEGEMVDVLVDGGQLVMNIVDVGYEFRVRGLDNASGCIKEEMISMSRLLDFEVNGFQSPSCESCTDGFIDLSVDSGSLTCIDCEVGDVIIIDKETTIDVTALNDAQELSKGEYYVIVLDSNDGCYIAHELITL